MKDSMLSRSCSFITTSFDVFCVRIINRLAFFAISTILNSRYRTSVLLSSVPVNATTVCQKNFSFPVMLKTIGIEPIGVRSKGNNLLNDYD